MALSRIIHNSASTLLSRILDPVPRHEMPREDKALWSLNSMCSRSLLTATHICQIQPSTTRTMDLHLTRTTASRSICRDPRCMAHKVFHSKDPHRNILTMVLFRNSSNTPIHSRFNRCMRKNSAVLRCHQISRNKKDHLPVQSRLHRSHNHSRFRNSNLRLSNINLRHHSSRNPSNSNKLLFSRCLSL